METESLRRVAITENSVPAPLDDALNQMELTSADHLLRLWLETPDAVEAQTVLTILLTEQVAPVIKTVVSYKLRVGIEGGSKAVEVEDLCSEVTVKVLKFLQQAKTAAQPKTIGDFRNYVAVIAHHTCAEFLRQKYPQRQRLKDKLRYLLTRQPGLSLWETGRRMWVCGLAVWQQKAVATIPAMQIKQKGEAFFAEHHRKLPLGETLVAFFQDVEGPVEFDLLVNLVATHTQEISGSRSIETPWPDPFSHLPVHSATLSTLTAETEQRLYLRQIWLEICKLPLPNRTALLLNLRDAEEKGLIALLADIQIVSLLEIAQALAFTPSHFAQIWQALPLDDRQIAVLLGVTRQQVINLRKAARKWLSRQLNLSPPPA